MKKFATTVERYIWPQPDPQDVNPKIRFAQRKEFMLPFKSIPNIKAVTVIRYPWDPIYEFFGIQKRMKPAKIETLKYKNGKFNRYMFYKLKYLANLKMVESRPFWKYMHEPGDMLSKDRRYWEQVDQLMKNSIVFQYNSLIHVFPKWHRDYPLWWVKRIIKRVKSIHTEEKDFDLKRVYIPKANGKMRPLGVPTPEWRVYLCLLNKFLTFRHKKNMQDRQHGFVPGKGTLSAWKAILTDVIQEPDIYEFDFRNAFNSVKLSYLKEILRGYHVTDKFSNIILMCSLVPVKGNLKEESENIAWRELIGTESVGKQLRNSMLPMLGNFLNTAVFHMPRKEGNSSSVIDAINKGTINGVAQGSPVSPVLFALAVGKFFRYLEHMLKIKILSYADDGLVYGTLEDKSYNLPIDIEETVEMHDHEGFKFAEEKCGMIKEKGVWLKPLKFLGLEYDGNTGILRGSTRNGSTLIFDKEKLLAWEQFSEGTQMESGGLYLLDGKERVSHDGKEYDVDAKYRVIATSEIPVYELGANTSFIRDLASSKMIGYAQSRMFIGSWDFKIEQNFNYEYKNNTWSHMMYKKGKILNVFNSSSFAAQYLIEELSSPNKTIAKQKKRKVLQEMQELKLYRNLIAADGERLVKEVASNIFYYASYFVDYLKTGIITVMKPKLIAILERRHIMDMMKPIWLRVPEPALERQQKVMDSDPSLWLKSKKYKRRIPITRAKRA